MALGDKMNGERSELQMREGHLENIVRSVSTPLYSSFPMVTNRPCYTTLCWDRPGRSQ